VGRRWLPWRPRKRNIDVPEIDLSSFADGLVAALLLVSAAFVLGLVLSLVGIVVLFAAEWLVIALIVPLGGLSRLAWRKPWTLYAMTRDHVVRRKAVGWAASKAMIDQMAEEIERTGHPSACPE
jgi:hypothetical protein